MALDFDDCVDPETGEIHPQVKAVIDRVDSYSERSVSGTGVHVFVKAKTPDERLTWRTAQRPEGFKIEIGSERHFITICGDHIEGTPTTLEERTEVIADLYQKYFPPKPEPMPYESSTVPSSLSDNEIIKRMCASSVKMKKLWSGDMSDYADNSPDGVDHSAADVALCCSLAFWTGRDAARMDRLFRQSGLMREKWKGDYSNRTLRYALTHTADIVVIVSDHSQGPHRSISGGVQEDRQGT